MTDENINFIRNCNNIVPYKENILDSAISKLDKFSDIKTPFKHDIVKAYEVNKNFVWIYLDNLIYNHPQWFERLLQQYDIPYTYFNLDKDNYYEVFGWEIAIDSDITHPNQRWSGLDERYNPVKEIAFATPSISSEISRTSCTTASVLDKDDPGGNCITVIKYC